MAAEAAKETELWRRTRRRDVGVGEEELEQTTTVVGLLQLFTWTLLCRLPGFSQTFKLVLEILKEEWERAEAEEETMVLFGPQAE